MKSLRISLLGAPWVEVDGAPLAVDTRKATAMLAFLAVTGHSHARGGVADLLWAELDADRSRGALRRTLSTLRSALGEGRVVSDRDSIALDLYGAWFDLAEFRSVAGDPDAETSALIAACDLHRGDLMAGFGLRDSLAFDEWQRDAEELVRRERAALLDRVVDRLAREGRVDDAVVRARQRLELDQLHEPTHRRLIECYAAAGRRGDAFTQYRECVRVLDRELGVQPLSATIELYNAISAPTTVQVVVEEPARLVAALPLVGRAVELRRLVTSFEAIGDDGVLVMIEGESGVGKTRLAEEALGALQAGGTPVIAARAQAGERGLAYGVVAQLLLEAIGSEADALPQPLRGEAARLLPQLGAAPSGRLDDPGCRLRFLESVCEIVAGRSRRAGAVVFVDDLHWCDPASLDALAYLARRLDDRRLMLLCARRIDEPDPEHRLAALVELGKRIQLGRLGRDDVVGVAMRTGLDKGAADEVFRESEGLALFVAELLATGDGTDRPPGGARAAIEARLDAVSEASAQVLSAAAVIGRTFDADTVRFASGRSSEEIAVALEELGARGLILERGEGYDFGHERLRTIVEQRIGLARRRLLHRRIARALSARRGEPAILARHFERSRDSTSRPRSRTRPPAIARERCPPVPRRSPTTRQPTPSATPTRRCSTRRLGTRGRCEASIPRRSPPTTAPQQTPLKRPSHDSSTSSARSMSAAATGSSPTATTSRHSRSAPIRRSSWQTEAALRGGAAMRTRHERSACKRSRSRRRAARRAQAPRAARRPRAVRTARAPRAARAVRRAPPPLPRPRPRPPRPTTSSACSAAAGAIFERSLELSRDLADPSIRIAALNNLARDHAAAGELEQAEALMRQALEECVTQGDRHHEAALHANLADVLHKAGRPDAAIDEARAGRPNARGDRGRRRRPLPRCVEPGRVVAAIKTVRRPVRRP